MTYYDTLQQNSAHNSQFGPQQWGAFGSPGQPYAAWPNMPMMQATGGFGPGQAAYGQQYGQGQYGQYGGQQSPGGFGSGWGAQQPQGWGQQAWGGQQPWGGQQAWGGQQPWGGMQQRQLSQQDVSEVVRQLVPVLPQVLAQAQGSHAGIGYAAYGQAPRMLSQQDINEVVRQILPIVPQIVGMLQNQPQAQYGGIPGGLGFGQFGLGQSGLGQSGIGHPAQNFGAQAAFGSPSGFGFGQQQRQLTQQDVADITRQLIGVIPQVIGNLQAFNQQRMN
jgi:hypothetical protein